MTINYTTLLGLAKPVTGTESGAWGDVVNDQITSLVEDAIANAASINVTSGNVTLTDNNGTSDQARMAILLVTGSPGVSRNIVAPSTSKWYIVKNSSNAQVVLKGSATTGVTIPAGAEVLAFWNGSDFEIAGMVGPSTSTDNAVARFDGTTGKIVQNSSVVIDDSNNITGIVDETLSGNLNFTGTAKRITGDFSNATASNLLLFQTSTSNGTTSIGAIPNGTGNLANFFVVNNSNPANSGAGGIGIDAAQVFVTSSIFGSGTYLPMTFFTNGSERMRIDTSGNVGIGATSPADILQVVKTTASGTYRTRFILDNQDQRSVIASYYQFGVGQRTVIQSTGASGTADNPISFETGTTERMRIDSSGNVGIGTTSPVARLDIISGTARMYFSNQSATAFFTAVNTTNTAYAPMAINGSEMILKTSDAERININGSGFVGINQTPNGNATFQVQETGSASRRVAEFYLAVASSTSTPAVRFNKYDNDTTTSNKFVEFTINQLNNGSGQINANGASQAAFGTFSDIRLKENIQDLPPQLSNICALRPVEFDYKDGSGHQIGFIAQEMQQVYPDVVGVDRDEMLTVTGWDKTTSRLVKAIQEQQTIIESLTARIAALESKGA